MSTSTGPEAAEVTGCPVDESFDPLSAEFLADPYAVMAALQDNVLLHLATGALLVVGTLIGLV